jgi:hypothetical protein
MSFDSADLVVIGGTIAVVIAVVFVHYEGLRFFSNSLPFGQLKPRLQVAAVVCGLLLLHSIEIWIFALGYYLLLLFPGMGAIEGVVPTFALGDYVYFSSTAYSTLGYGEIYPVGPIRLLTGMEGVTGLLMITWSASFTYLEMQRYWVKED